MITDGRGIGAEYIHESCPTELKPYEKAYELKVKNADAMIHSWVGSYGISALIFSIDHCLNKKATTKYIKNPVCANIKDKSNECKNSNEEIAVFEMKQRTKFLKKQGLLESPM